MDDTTTKSTTDRNAISAVTVRDPVCGMNVNPDSAKQVESFAGQQYYFCGAGCLSKFRSEPSRYVGEDPKLPEVEAGAVGETRVYTCSMHPEIRKNGPGSCPKCGMAIERMAPVSTSAREWVCPMHPQIVQSEPGTCPICGMALEPRDVAMYDEENTELVDMRRRFWVSVVLTILVVITAMGDVVPDSWWTTPEP